MSDMTVSAAAAARALCEMRDWGVSNLEMQKILYLAQMYTMGIDPTAPLIHEDFEAWDYGPVIPDLYHRAKAFGPRRVRNVFHGVRNLPPESFEYRALRRISDATKGMSPARLVANTHRHGGAWSQVYVPGEKGIVIPRHLIAQEANARGGRVA